MKRFLLADVAWLVASVVAHAAATANFPNINVRTNAQVGGTNFVKDTVVTNALTLQSATASRVLATDGSKGAVSVSGIGPLNGDATATTLGQITNLLNMTGIGLSLAEAASEASARSTISAPLTNGTVNVKDSPYNATGDGTTDDTSAVQNALTNLSVYFPAGTYLCSTLYPTNGVVYGSGQNSKLVWKTPTVSSNFINCAANATVIQNLWIDGNTNYNYNVGSAPTHWTTGIVSYAISGARVQNCKVSEFATAIYVTGPNSITTRPASGIYTGNFITNNQTAFWLADNNAAEYCLFEANQIRGNYNSFIDNSAANVLVSGNVMTDSGGLGYYSAPTSKRGHSLIEANLINHAASPVYLTGISLTDFVANHIEGGGVVTLINCTNVTFVNNQLELTTIAFTAGVSNIFRGNLLTTSPSVTGSSAVNFLPLENRANGNVFWSGLSGSCTLTNGQTAAVVNHGLAIAPAIADLILTPVQTNRAAATTNGFAITATSATTFTITVSADPGTDLNFTWRHLD